MSSTRLPSLFVSHGAPTLALADTPTTRFLDRLGREWPTPRAILIASAHFNAPRPTLTSGEHPQTVHDFHGFPPELYALRYAAPGAPALAQRAADLLRGAGHDAVLDPNAGFDHGVWEPLLRLRPTADVPVVALSVSPTRDARWHYDIGRALAPLRDEGVLVVGSGGFSHNLRELDWRGGNAAAPAWLTEFVEPLRARLVAGDIDGALDWHTLPHANRNHPTPEHLLPLFVALGAAGPSPTTTHLHRDTEMNALALDAFSFAG